MATKKSEEKVIEIKPIEVEIAKVRIEGISPLIMHKWAEKAKKEILDKQMKKASAGARATKNPVEDFIKSMYWLTEEPKEMTIEAYEEAIKKGARFGFPATAIKQAAQSAAYRSGLIDNQMALRGCFHIHSDETGLVEVIADEVPVMREDMVKVGMGTADIRYRGMLTKWHIDLEIEYNKNGKYST